MGTTSLDAAPRSAAAVAVPQTPRDRVRRRLGWLWMALAAAPFLIAAARFAVVGDLTLGSDFALTALDVTDAGRLDQAVGPYSRWGWAHPGPAWFSLLLPVFAMLGSTGAALVVASLTLHGFFAALVVAAAGRSRPWAQPLAAGLLLLYVLRMPDRVFALVWNPYALLLPTALLLTLAARAALGSLPAAAGTVLVGSYLVQTHVGTAPLVGLVVVAAAAGAALTAWRGELPERGRREWYLAAAGVAGTALLWLPPLLQQLTAAPGEGNLGSLAAYFSAEKAEGTLTYTWPQAFSAFAQMLGMPVHGWQATAGDIDTGDRSLGVLVTGGAQLAGAAALLGVGLLIGRRRSAALGAVLLAGGVAGVVACHSVTGAMSNYLAVWITVLPAVLLFGWLDLAVDRLVPRGRAGTRAVVVVAVLTTAVAAGTTTALTGATDALGDQPGVDDGARIALDELPPPTADQPPVLLDIASDALWPTATGIALQLEQAGHRVSVDPSWTKLFGRDRLAQGTEVWRLTVVVDSYAPQLPYGTVIGTVPTDSGADAALLLSRLPG
ncbi:hypothetical protein SAMN05660485_01674 [Blastococcus fimeti]|nr:hypothetical protein SAMN05660485_01674 [Blastococcus fimeti]